ncbi:alanyl-tRNA editing protein [Niastella koreensis]|nr:alanyl-tRNA editing protein [Niastella koreensis]OQP40576.1 alanyl-tRNA editing protein [Niastella koreensis]
MTVRKLFWDDPYQTSLVTHVKSVENGVITLFETIAYAFSGGQQSDTGTMNGYKIITARKEGKEIYYILEEGHALQAGDEVRIEIDWDARYKLMKLHFAAEIILELVNQHFGCPVKIGANITTEKSRLDFIWENNISEMFPLLTAKAKEIIDADLPIESAFSDPVNEVRYWRIEGFGQVPCGGTHIKTTGEIGPIQLKRNRQGKNKERIEIYLT